MARFGWLACCAVLLLGWAAGCGESERLGQLDVAPGSSRMDEPVALRVSHLDPGSPVDLSLRSVDAGGTTWTSQASFLADAAGTVDPGRMAPTAGTYVGTWGMGLFSVMIPSAAVAGYRWPTAGAATFEVGLRQNGRTVATTTISRTMWTQPPKIRMFTKAADGFAGMYVTPSQVQRGPAVVVLGGSEGGDPTFRAMVFAARGIPALSVAYVNYPGLPSQLKDIPLEYFDAPLRWLRRQPGVDAERVWISGASRGSEAAALVAAGRPDLVHGLLDLSPSATASCARVPSTHDPCSGPVWLRGGRQVPYTSQPNVATPSDEPDAVIAVEAINGPVLTLCGGADLLWSSCTYSDAIQRRLKDHRFRFPRLALSYPDAGHAVDFPMPFEPRAPARPGDPATYGSTPTANEQARADAWPKVLAFLRNPAAAPDHGEPR